MGGISAQTAGETSKKEGVDDRRTERVQTGVPSAGYAEIVPKDETGTGAAGKNQKTATGLLEKPAGREKNRKENQMPEIRPHVLSHPF